MHCGKHPPPAEMCVPELAPRKEMSLGRCGPQEGDVPRKMSPANRCLWEGDVPGKKTSLGGCHPHEGGIPGKVSSAGRLAWEEDVPVKETSLLQAAQSQWDPHPSMIMKGPQSKDTATLGERGGSQGGRRDTEPTGSSVCHHPSLINVVLSSP